MIRQKIRCTAIGCSQFELLASPNSRLACSSAPLPDVRATPSLSLYLCVRRIFRVHLYMYESVQPSRSARDLSLSLSFPLSRSRPRRRREREREREREKERKSAPESPRARQEGRKNLEKKSNFVAMPTDGPLRSLSLSLQAYIPRLALALIKIPKLLYTCIFLFISNILCIYFHFAVHPVFTLNACVSFIRCITVQV